MIIYVGKDYQDVSRKAANIMSAQIIMKPNAVLGLATGSTPVGLYKQLIEWYNKGDLDFSQITSVNLDEYKGLSGDNDQSYRYFMNTNLFDHVNIDKNKTYVPNGLEEDSDKACADYNEIIRSVGGIDIQLLGIGGNGHIGFNEPGEAFEKETHCVDLTESTIKANARFFEGIHHGNQEHYGSKENPSCSNRKCQGRRFVQIPVWTDHTKCTCIYPSASSGCNRSGR